MRFSALISNAVTLALKSWLAFIMILVVRGAIGVLSIFPWVMAIMIVIRAFVAAPPVDGSEATLGAILWWRGVAAEPQIILAFAGIFTVVWGLSFVLNALIDGGIFGAMAAGVRDGRGMQIGALFSSGLLLFDRSVALSLIYGGATLLAKVFVLSVGAMWLLTQDAATLSWEAAAHGAGPYLVVAAAMAALFWLFCFMVYLAAMSAAAVDGTSVAASIVTGARFVIQHASKMLVPLTFFGVIAASWFVLRTGGTTFFFKLLERAPGSQIINTLSNAWEISLALMAAFLWLMIVAAQLLLYTRFHPENRYHAIVPVAPRQRA